MFQKERFVFQQENTPPIRSERCKHWCRRDFPDFVSVDEWLSMPPDLNSMDYSV
jgi:hypothetical protein